MKMHDPPHPGEAMSMRKTKISKARSFQEAGDYWDTHDLSEVWDQTEPVEMDVDLAPVRHLFVYGTLMQGEDNPVRQELEAGTELVGRATMSGARLYAVDWHPAAVPSPNAVDVVHGEVYLLRDSERVIEALDRYEGCAPDDPEPRYFRRVARSVEVDGGETVQAWVYLWNRLVEELPRIPSGDWRTR